jgi:hypothetical protein
MMSSHGQHLVGSTASKHITQMRGWNLRRRLLRALAPVVGIAITAPVMIWVYQNRSYVQAWLKR